jgi:two-component system, NarL family, invasion response regulator UvrY
MSDKINIAYVEDVIMLRESIVKALTEISPNCDVIIEASNGKELIRKIESSETIPDIAIVDMEMPVMNGFETVTWLKQNYPQIKILILSQVLDEFQIIRIMKLGLSGYLSKFYDLHHIGTAIDIIYNGGQYFPDMMKEKLDYALSPLSINNVKKDLTENSFTEIETQFIELSCSELSNKEIANKMNLSERTIDGYCQRVAQKMNVKNRKGIIVYAFTNNLVKKGYEI